MPGLVIPSCRQGDTEGIKTWGESLKRRAPRGEHVGCKWGNTETRREGWGWGERDVLSHLARACEGKHAQRSRRCWSRRAEQRSSSSAFPGWHALVCAATRQAQGPSGEPGKGELSLTPTEDTDPRPSCPACLQWCGGRWPLIATCTTRGPAGTRENSRWIYHFFHCRWFCPWLCWSFQGKYQIKPWWKQTATDLWLQFLIKFFFCSCSLTCNTLGSTVNLEEGNKYSFALLMGNSPFWPGERSLIVPLLEADRVREARLSTTAAKSRQGLSGGWWLSLDSDSASAQGFPAWFDMWQQVSHDRESLCDICSDDGYTSLPKRCPLCKNPGQEKAALISALVYQEAFLGLDNLPSDSRKGIIIR